MYLEDQVVARIAELLKHCYGEYLMKDEEALRISKELEEQLHERQREEELQSKLEALAHFEQALADGGKYFDLDLVDDETVSVRDKVSGHTKLVNIACDNVPAMIYDILKQARYWIM